MTPYPGVALQAGCNCDVRIGNLYGWKAPPVEASSGKEWQLKISIVKAHIGRSSGRSDWQIYPPKLGRSPQLSIDPVNTATPNLADLLADKPPMVNASSGQECQFQISIVKSHIGRSTGRSTPHQLSIDALQTVTSNLADLPADLPPLVGTSSGKEWQFRISIVKAHVGISSGLSAWQIYPLST